MDNLVIIANMVSPILFEYPINLDSLLIYEYEKQNNPNFYNINPKTDNFEYSKEIPIDIVKYREGWFYSCSDSLYIVDKVVKKYWTRRTDDKNIENVLKIKKKINLGGGKLRNYRMPIFLKRVKKLLWFIRGDRLLIKNLLININHLGKKHTAQGRGGVYKWEVITIDNDYSIYYKDKLVKTLPTEYLGDKMDVSEGYIMRRMNYKPPYFLRPPHPKCTETFCITMTDLIRAKIYAEIMKTLFDKNIVYNKVNIPEENLIADADNFDIDNLIDQQKGNY